MSTQTYLVRTTHGKARLRAKRSFGPVAVRVDLTDEEAALVRADPFFEIVFVPDTAPEMTLNVSAFLGAQAAKDAEDEADADAKLEVPGKDAQQLADEADADAKLAVKPELPKATKKAKG